MGSPKGTETFPAADAGASLNPGKDNDFQVDPVSEEVAKEQGEAAEMQKNKGHPLRTLKRAVIASAVIAAVAGAAIAITKKLKEK